MNAHYGGKENELNVMFLNKHNYLCNMLLDPTRVQMSHLPDWNSFLIDLSYGGLGGPIALNYHLNSHF